MSLKKITLAILLVLMPYKSYCATQDLLLSLLAIPPLSHKVLVMLSNEINERFGTPTTHEMAVVYVDRMIQDLSGIGILCEHHPIAFHKLLGISQQSEQKVLFNCIHIIIDYLVQQYMLVDSNSVDTIVETITQDIPAQIKNFVINESKEKIYTRYKPKQ
jgi:hypothetical protein